MSSSSAFKALNELDNPVRLGPTWIYKVRTLLAAHEIYTSRSKSKQLQKRWLTTKIAFTLVIGSAAI